MQLASIKLCGVLFAAGAMVVKATVSNARHEQLVRRFEDLAGRAEVRARGIYER